MSRDTSIIRSLDKGLELLEIIEQETYPVSLTVLWKKLGWDKATIHRMCATLERRGYLYRDPKTKRYSLGLKIFGLYESIVKNVDVQRTARPYLEQIEKETRESTHLGLVFEQSVVFIDKVMGRDFSPVNVQIGGREPLYCTALGKAYLAFVDEAELYGLVPEPFRKYTEHTPRSFEELKNELRLIRQRGYSTDLEEYIEGVRCIASPILNQTGRPAAMLGIAAPKERLPEERIKRYGESIKEAALKISACLGYSR